MARSLVRGLLRQTLGLLRVAYLRCRQHPGCQVQLSLLEVARASANPGERLTAIAICTASMVATETAVTSKALTCCAG